MWLVCHQSLLWCTFIACAVAISDPTPPLLPAQFDCKARIDVGYTNEDDRQQPTLLLMHADLVNGRVREDYYRLPDNKHGTDPASGPRKV